MAAGRWRKQGAEAPCSGTCANQVLPEVLPEKTACSVHHSTTELCAARFTVCCAARFAHASRYAARHALRSALRYALLCAARLLAAQNTRTATSACLHEMVSGP
eukprot:353684-Chlamydomonas_euryale.AAC.4